MMTRYLSLAYTLLVVAGCGTSRSVMEVSQKAAAERFFRGVYGCETSVVDELAAEGIVSSYPVFQQLFGVAAFVGRDAVRDFASGFCSRWADVHITIHDAIEEGKDVVLVWSFQARSRVADEVRSWGGMTLLRFNDQGEIVLETGEESEPGPIERLRWSTESGHQEGCWSNAHASIVGDRWFPRPIAS